MAYKCMGGGNYFGVVDVDTGKNMCNVIAVGSEKNGYMVRVTEPSGRFTVYRLNDLDDELSAIAQLPNVGPEVREAISYALHDIKSGLPIGFTAAQQRAAEQEQAQPTLPIEGRFNGLTYRISDIGNGEKRLDIYGTGKIPDADPNHPYPWDEYSDSITAVWVHDGVEIGSGFLDGFENASFVLPDSIDAPQRE